MKLIKYFLEEILSLLYFLVVWGIVAVIITYSLRWLGFSEGTNRTVNTVWFILRVVWSVSTHKYSKKNRLSRDRTAEESELQSHFVQAQNEGHATPQKEELIAPLGKREQAIQKVMAAHGLSREEVEAQLKPYGL